VLLAKMQWLTRLAEIGITDSAKEILTLKTENAPAKLKNLKTRSCGIRWIKTSFKQKRSLPYSSELPNKPFSFDYIN